MMKTNELFPIHKLIGSHEENFYTLGVIDREHFADTMNGMKALIRTPWKKTDILAQKGLKFLVRRTLKKHPSFDRHIRDYARGLKADKEEIAMALLLPEYMSSIGKWLPGLPATVLGCSSYFTMAQEGPIHLRILDFPLMGTYDRHERAVLYQSNGYPSIFSYSSAGLPYPSLTAMTSEGVTLGMHQKFTNVFNPGGMPIFEMVWQLLNNVHDLPSTMAFLRKCQTITTWCLYMSFKDGQTLAVDIAGGDLYHREYNLEKSNVLYFNNLPINEQFRPNDCLPFGMTGYCDMRKSMAKNKIDHFLRHNNEALTADSFLRVMATPHITQEKSAEQWKLDPSSPSGMTVVTMSPRTGTSCVIPGPAPKFYQGKVVYIDHCLVDPQVTLKEGVSPVPENYHQGLREYMLAQSAVDAKDMPRAYQHIQNSINYLDSYTEVFIARFYANVFRFMNETKRSALEETLQNFEELKGKLPPYLQDHTTLFITRLQRMTGKKVTTSLEAIVHPRLKKLFAAEKKIPAIFLRKIVASLMNPRLDILDVIYGHLR